MTTVPPQRHIETAISAVICALALIWLSSCAVVAKAQIMDEEMGWMLDAVTRPVASGAVATGWTDPYESLLNMRAWMDDDTYKTNDSSASAFTFSEVGGIAREVIGTNSNGRVDNAYRVTGDGTYLQSKTTVSMTVTAIAFSVWIKPSSWPSNYDGIMSVGSANPCAELYNNSAVGAGAGALLFQFRAGLPDATTTDTGITTLLPTNSWHHIVAQWAATNKFAIYIDGTNKSLTVRDSPLAVFTNSSYHYIGKFGRYAGQMRGLIDDARVYTNIFFSASEVTNLRANTFKPNGDIENGGTKWP